MGFILRLPSVNAPTDTEKIEQIRTYLYQTIKDIEWSLNSLDSTNATTVEAREVDGTSIFSVIKPMIVRSGDIINAYYNIIKDRLDDIYVSKNDMTYKAVTGNIRTYAASAKNGMTLITTDEHTTGIPDTFGNCVGFIHKFSHYVVIEIIDIASGSVATNASLASVWNDWSILVPASVEEEEGGSL